jgi:GxxExxY protein
VGKSYFDGVAEIRDPQTYRIIGAAMEVHREFGCGFLEAAYQEAMELELAVQQIPFAPQVELAIVYKGWPLKCKYRADFICFGEVIVEVKALAQITGIERAQVINYLKATGYKRALILNFGTTGLQYERVVLNA